MQASGVNVCGIKSISVEFSFSELIIELSIKIYEVEALLISYIFVDITVYSFV